MGKLKNPKAKGSAAERKSKKLLESQGRIVVKSGGSFGMADLVALAYKEVSLIQVKAGSARMSPKEKQELIDQAKKLGAYAVLHEWKDYKGLTVTTLYSPYQTYLVAPGPESLEDLIKR